MSLFFRRYSLFLAWLLSMIATIGSLYFSEIRHWTPCNICWYQRICLFPLVIILGIAAYRNDRRIGTYVFFQVLAGAFLALYQLVQGHLPHMFSTVLCGPESSCVENQFTLFSWISLPLLGLLAFLGIFVLLLLAKISHPNKQK